MLSFIPRQFTGHVSLLWHKIQCRFCGTLTEPLLLGSSLDGIKEESFLLSLPSVLTFLVTGQEMAAG